MASADWSRVLRLAGLTRAYQDLDLDGADRRSPPHRCLCPRPAAHGPAAVFRAGSRRVSRETARLIPKAAFPSAELAKPRYRLQGCRSRSDRRRQQRRLIRPGPVTVNRPGRLHGGPGRRDGRATGRHMAGHRCLPDGYPQAGRSYGSGPRGGSELEDVRLRCRFHVKHGR